MKKAQWMSVIRHTLTFVGGLLVIKGTLDESTSEQIISGLMTLVGLVWGVLDKKERD